MATRTEDLAELDRIVKQLTSSKSELMRLKLDVEDILEEIQHSIADLGNLREVIEEEGDEEEEEEEDGLTE